MKNKVPQLPPEIADAPWPADRVIHTELLRQRPSKTPDLQAESAAMLELVGALATDPDSITQRLVDAALRLTQAGSTGLSLAETGGGEELPRWIATAGEYARYLRGTMPRHFSLAARCCVTPAPC